MSPCSFSNLTEDLREVRTVHEPHRVIVNPAIDADRVDRHDVRMLQMGRHPGLVLEPRQPTFVEQGANGSVLSATRLRSDSCSAS